MEQVEGISFVLLFLFFFLQFSGSFIESKIAAKKAAFVLLDLSAHLNCVDYVAFVCVNHTKCAETCWQCFIMSLTDVVNGWSLLITGCDVIPSVIFHMYLLSKGRRKLDFFVMFVSQRIVFELLWPLSHTLLSNYSERWQFSPTFVSEQYKCSPIKELIKSYVSNSYCHVTSLIHLRAAYQ